MCGIIGTVGNIEDKDINWLDKATLYLKHRGPDASSRWISPSMNAAFAHRRLSIIDTGQSSDQPFISEDKKIILVYNGEIYNFRELRTELIAEGVKFNSHSDTEVLLNLYIKEGKGMLHKLNGIFAFALWDQRSQSLFLARDNFGIKPLYYVR